MSKFFESSAVRKAFALPVPAGLVIATSTLFLSSCMFMPELESGLFTAKKTSNDATAVLSQCEDSKGKNLYLSSVNSVLENKCAGCHSSLSFRIIRGGAEANYTLAKKRGKTFIEYAAGRATHPGGAVIDASEESLINRWLATEAECRTTKPVIVNDAVCSVATRPSEITIPGNVTNAARSSGSGLYLRLAALFPGQTISQREFSLYESTGFNKVLAVPQRFTSVAAQIAFLSKIERNCNTAVRGPKNSAGNLFGEFKLTGEVLPTDLDARDVLLMARNIWLYPYDQRAKEIVELQMTYTKSMQAVKAEGKSDDESKKVGKITACVTALQSPQFWLGNPGPFDVLRKTAIEVGQVIPTPADFNALKSASNRAQWMKNYVANLQKSGPGYLAAIKYWHQDWLGSRPFATGFDPRLGTGGQREYAAANGASGVMGTIAHIYKATAPNTPLADQTILTALVDQMDKSLVHNSENCENKIQNFDPRTTRLVWEHRNPNLNGAFEVVGALEKNGNNWVSVPGSVTLANGAKRKTTIADINFGFQNGNRFKYNLGNLVGTPMENFDSGDRRIRRFSPSGEQNGYSAVSLYYSGQTAYTCNTLTRFIASCAYRPGSTEQVSTGSFIYNEANRGSGRTAAWNGEGTASFNADGSYSARIPRPIWFGANSFTDSFAHGKILDQFRCGTPNRAEIEHFGSNGYNENIAFPKGYVSETSANAPDPATLNSYAYNIHYQNKHLPDGAEKTALDTVSADLSQEASRIIGNVLENDIDYREILLAQYTFGSDYMKHVLSTQNFTLPFRTENVELSNSPTTVKKILASSLGTLNRQWLSGPLGTTSLSGSLNNFINNTALNKNGDLFLAKPMQGILTTSEFLVPVSPGIRTVSTRIITRLLCSDVNGYVPTSNETVLHRKFVTQATHLSPGCLGCHINLDPLATALNVNFAGDSSKRFGGKWGTEIETNVSGYYGIRGIQNPGEGALLGKPARGIAGVADIVANSDQFARCTVQKAFENIFGRSVPSVSDCKLAPGHPDCALVDQTAAKFKTSLGYNYNKMIQELVSSDLNLKGN